MAVAAKPFTTCHYCELRAATKHKSLVSAHAGGRRREVFIYACFLHGEQAEREARASRSRS